MKRSTFLIPLAAATFAFCSFPAASRAAADNTRDMAALARFGEAYVEAFNSADAGAVAAFWTPEGDYVDQAGHIFKGRAAIEGVFAKFFAGNKGMKLRIDSDSLNFPAPGTAIEDGATAVVFADGTPPARGHFTNVLVKEDGKWLLASVRETEFVPPRNGKNLEPLAWVIGEWTDDAKSNDVAHATFEWSPDGNFIISRQAVTLRDELLSIGTQFIGWDPATSQIRSWNFESDGGFGEGVWTTGKDTWIVHTNATLPSGKKLVATNTIARDGDGSITWQSTGRTLDGKPLPDTDKVKLKRVN